MMRFAYKPSTIKRPKTMMNSETSKVLKMEPFEDALFL